jgi:cardiolipin synthase
MASSNIPKQRRSGVSKLVLLRSGADYFRKLEELIGEAQEEIHLQTYILEPDRTGMKIAEALIAAARRGVRIFLMLDAFGSSSFNGSVFDRLVQAGVIIQFYGRLFQKGRFHLGRRLHRKVFVADGHIALVGGINISEKYDSADGHVPWLDFAVWVEGPVARRLRLICRQRWLNIRIRKKSQYLRHPSMPEQEYELLSGSVRVTQNDFLRKKNEIAISYRRAIRESRESLVIVGGYFLPGGKIRRLLRAARKRGVSIRLLLAAKSDVMISVYARQYLYRWLVRHGIEIHEYLPANVHGKVLVADGRFVSIGSYDLNNLSTYSNIELNLSILHEPFVDDLKKCLEEIIAHDCRQVDAVRLRARESALYLFRCWVAYRVTKTLFGLAWLLSKSGTKG